MALLLVMNSDKLFNHDRVNSGKRKSPMADGKKTGRGASSLVVFDVEGILIPKNRYLLFEVSRKVGFLGFIRVLALGFLYEIGLLSLESALRRIFAMLKGLEAEEILEKFSKH
jgi:hypothetical protein